MKLIKFKKIKKPSGFFIEKLCATTQEVVRQLRAMNYPVEHMDSIWVHCIHEKLDAETSRDWEIQRKSETPTFNDIIKFLRVRGRALSSAQADERKEDENRKRHANDSKKPDAKKFKKDYSSADKKELPAPRTSDAGLQIHKLQNL